jgi:hypothetical protein
MTLPGYAQAAAIGRTGIAVGTLTQVPTLNAHGALLGLHDTHRAASMVDPAPAPNGNGDNHASQGSRGPPTALNLSCTPTATGLKPKRSARDTPARNGSLPPRQRHRV